MNYKKNAKFLRKKTENALSIQEKYLFLHTFSEGKGAAKRRKKSFFHILPV